MDEELFKQRAKDAGYSDKEIEAYLVKKRVKGYDTSLSNPANLARSALQGATLNFGDELAGLLPKWMQENVTGTPDQIRDREKAFHKDHPVASTLANVAGGFVLPGGGTAAAAKGATTVMGTIARGALLGGAAGGLSAMGAGKGDIAHRAEGAAPAALIGAGIGAVLPGLPGAVRSVVSPAKKAAGRVQGAIDRSGGVDALLARLKAFQGGDRGAEVTLADLSNPLRQAADVSANNSDEAADLFNKVVAPRQRNATGRLLDDAQSRIGNPQADQIVDDLAKSRQAWADGPNGYGGLRQKNPQIVPVMAEEFNNLLQTPAVKSAWQQAREVGLIGPMPKSGSVSFDVMQGALERLDTAKESAFRSGAKDLAFRLKGAQEALEQQMTNAVPGFNRVHTEYGVRKSLERAVRRGEELFDEEDTRGLSNELSTYTTQQVDQLRKGLASKMLSRLRSAQTNRDEAGRLMARSAPMEDKLNLIFGGRKQFEEFIERADLEAEMAKLRKVLGGSQTHRRGMAGAVDGAEILAHAATGHPASAAIGAFRRMLPHAVRSGTAKEMAPLLTTQGAPNLEKLLQQWGRRGDLLPAWASTMLPVGAAGGAGGLFGN